MKKVLRLSSIVMVLCLCMALNPSRTYKQRPEKYNMKYEEHKLPTGDGDATINVWHFDAKTKSDKCMLICHNGDGNMADYLRRVDQFTGLNYNVVLFDYRGFGESSEFEIDNNMYIYPHFTDDVETVIDYCRKKYTTFSLYGWGMGAGLALGMGYNRPEVEAIIADAPFTCLDTLEARFRTWEEPLEVPFAGYQKRFEPLFALQNAPQKNLKDIKLVIGSNDPIMNKADMEQLQKLQKKLINEKIYVVENPDQKDNFKLDQAAY
ncbi:MAG: alpha/beta hydrolase, partial [Bacteroidetes bacterium]|nr:alpha/beta hydrolase [Bacteroidota bacterium]